MSNKNNNNRYFVKHSKSSAAFISLIIHAVLIVVAVSFVAVTVMQKDDQTFEQVEVHRPKVPFYELETSSPAAPLNPDETMQHVQWAFHFQGSEEFYSIRSLAACWGLG